MEDVRYFYMEKVYQGWNLPAFLPDEADRLEEKLNELQLKGHEHFLRIGCGLYPVTCLYDDALFVDQVGRTYGAHGGAAAGRLCFPDIISLQHAEFRVREQRERQVVFCLKILM